MHLTLPSLSFVTIPGRTSISSLTFKTPICTLIFTNLSLIFSFSFLVEEGGCLPRMILPPATPPFKSSTSAPGLLTSKERITIKLGEEVKSLTGMGIFFTMYSQITSMLNLSWAEMGIMGAPSATVPNSNKSMHLQINGANL